MRDHAGQYGVDPHRVGMIGFSAGAFLTVSVALDAGGPPLAFAAPIYGGETAGAAAAGTPTMIGATSRSRPSIEARAMFPARRPTFPKN